MIRAAKEWGRPPLSMLEGRPRPDWSEDDVLLATALTIHDAELRCPCGCGGYSDVTIGTDGWHDVAEIRCDARAAIEMHQRDAKGERDPGTFLVPVYTGSDN